MSELMECKSCGTFWSVLLSDDMCRDCFCLSIHNTAIEAAAKASWEVARKWSERTDIDQSARGWVMVALGESWGKIGALKKEPGK